MFFKSSRQHRYLLYFSLIASYATTIYPFPYTTLFRSVADGRGGQGPECLGDGERHPRRSRRADARHSLQPGAERSEEHTSELQSRRDLVCRLLLEKKKNN